MSSKVEGFRTVLGEFATAEAKNGSMKAVFALAVAWWRAVYKGQGVVGVEDKAITKGGYQRGVEATLIYVGESPGRPGIVMYPG